ncbi:MAG: YraN family protein [Hyphomicrobiaceae bacterium]
MSRRPTRDTQARYDERRARLRRGLLAEMIASVLLMAKGYRILARRHRTPFGEVDLIAARGRRLAFVEVKRRASIAEAEASLTPTQAARIGRAADHWLDRNPAHRGAEIGLDAILVVPRRWPSHRRNALDTL